MKKLFVLSAMCIVTMFFTNNAMSQVVASGTTGACTWTLTGLPGNYTLTISGSGAMGDYSSSSNTPWYSYRSNIKTLDLQQGVTSIGNFAFSGCYSLISVTIPNSVTSIGLGAFQSCSGLTSVTIGNSVTSIGTQAFFYCSGIISVTIGNSVTSIAMEAFAYCSSLASVTIPNSVTSIGEAAFFYCSGLISVTIGDSVTSIALETFAGCSSLTSVTIPNSVTSIGEAAFAGCSGLTSIDVDTSNPNYSSVNGILFNKLQDTLIQYPSGKIGDYTIPNSVMSIGNWAFYGCIGLTSITIPNSVTSVGNWAFYGCSGLTSITIPNSVTTIGDYAFAYCSDLTELHVKVQTPPALGDNPFMFVSDTIPVHVPCGTASVYQSASGWSGFSNYIDDLPLLNLTVESNDATMGTATIIQSNSCTDNTAIIQAVANQGYRFVQWNDGDTQNPRTITVTQDITYTAIFDTETGIPIVGTGHDLSLPQIYPNPATDNINIILPENRHQALFTLYDMQGKALIRKNINNWDVVSVSGLAAGIYVYSVKTATMSYTGKVVKE